MGALAAENVVYGREFSHILCDLDDCLYRIEVIPQSVAQNIKRYMVEKLGVPEAEVHDLSRELYHGYGTTMCGLLTHGYQLDVDDWHAAVHDSLEYDKLLHEQPTTRQVLARCNLQKHLLTNADCRHAVKCLKRLGISDCFQDIFCYENVQELGQQAGIITAERPVLCKPSKHVYQLVMERIGASASNTIFIDDSPRNISAAHELGIFTVLVSDDAQHVPGADLVVRHFDELPAVLPQLFAPDNTAAEPHADEVLAGVPIRVMAA
jgi:pyrimidine 5'-nucleotidase